MSNPTIHRPTTVIKALVKPIPTDVKTKIAMAVQTFVTKIKEKHL